MVSMSKTITVWGSPGSGKSMFCCIRQYLCTLAVNVRAISPACQDGAGQRSAPCQGKLLFGKALRPPVRRLQKVKQRQLPAPVAFRIAALPLQRIFSLPVQRLPVGRYVRHILCTQFRPPPMDIFQLCLACSIRSLPRQFLDLVSKLSL